MKRAVPIVIMVVAVIAALVVFRPREAVTVTYEAVSVQHGTIVDELHELGELVPRDPVLVKAPFSGRLRFVVEDGSWVDKDAMLFSIGDEDELKRLADDRGNLLTARQQMRLSLLRRQQAAHDEGRKLDAAKRNREVEELRMRVVETRPKGGMALVELHEKLLPLEAETEQVRAAYTKAQESYQASQDAYLDALDRMQEHRDAILRATQRCEELEAIASPDPGLITNAATRARRDQGVQELAEAKVTLDALRKRTGELTRALATARAARDATVTPRDAAQARLAERDRIERELYVAVEIEKRGAALAQLQLDEQGAKLGLADAEQRVAEGKRSFEAGAIGQAAYDDLQAALATARDNLTIISEKIALADRPTSPEILEEARMRLERARLRASQAQEVHDRNLELMDREIAVAKARVARLEYFVEMRAARFPSLIESNIEFAKRERENLDPDDHDRRAQLDADIARQEKQLVEAKKRPPNQVLSPGAGIVRVSRDHWSRRARQAGDRVWEDDALVELYPPANMEVRLRLNEVVVARVATGMRVTVIIPSLANLGIAGTVVQVSAVGRDKFADLKDEVGPAGVVQYDARIRLDQERDDFRQGMSALVDITCGSVESAWLPLGAVRRDGDRWVALAGDTPTPVPVHGRPYGADRFKVDGGLKPGDRVWIARQGNP